MFLSYLGRGQAIAVAYLPIFIDPFVERAGIGQFGKRAQGRDYQ
jgi:hypothetical protein